jgi:HemY protein
LTTLFEIQARSGNWPAAAETLDQAAKRNLIARDVARKRRAALACEQARIRAAAGADDEARALLRQAHRLDPGQAPIAAALVRALSAAGETREASKTAERAWREAAHPLLAAAYRDIVPGESPIERAKRFERLARLAPDHVESHLALAEAALGANLWGEARSHLRKVIDVGSDGGARAFRLMARVEESERQDHVAASAWLGRAARAPADPAWICQSCGAASDQWHAVCPSCRGVDMLRWERPRQASLPSPAT